jgi:hypothetical protein
MSDKPRLLYEGVRTEVSATINEIVDAINGAPAGVACLALLSLAIVEWRKTKLPLDDVHKTIDALAKASGEIKDN